MLPYQPINEKIMETINTSFPHLRPAEIPEPFEFFLTYGAGTPAASDPEAVKKTMAVFQSFGPDIRDRLAAYMKKRSEEA